MTGNNELVVGKASNSDYNTYQEWDYVVMGDSLAGARLAGKG